MTKLYNLYKKMCPRRQQPQNDASKSGMKKATSGDIYPKTPHILERSITNTWGKKHAQSAGQLSPPRCVDIQDPNDANLSDRESTTQ
jgi:hypothetical protein